MSAQPASSQRTQLGRKADRGSTDLELAREILDGALVGHIGLVLPDGYPAVLPVAIARQEGSAGHPDQVLFHGSTGSRLFRQLAAGAPTCLTVTHLDGLVLARSAFESSMNYRSLMVFGVARPVPDPLLPESLRCITDHLTPGRWDALRPMTGKEVAATSVLALPLVEFSVKLRAGGPGDSDESWPVWAGVLPLHTEVGTPVPDGDGTAPASWLELAGTVWSRESTAEAPTGD